MATPIATVVAALQPAGYATVGRVPVNITKPTVVVGIERVELGGIGRTRKWTIAVQVLSPLTDPEAADLDLEASVTEVLNALDQAPGLNWTTGEAGAVNEAFNAVKISVEVFTQEVS